MLYYRPPWLGPGTQKSRRTNRRISGNCALDYFLLLKALQSIRNGVYLQRSRIEFPATVKEVTWTRLNT